MGAVMRLLFALLILAVLTTHGQEPPQPAPTAQAYLYLEPFHARVEVMFDVATVQGWLKQPSDAAAPMPMAVSSFFDTPMNGHRPSIFAMTMLLTNTVAIRMSRYCSMGRTGWMADYPPGQRRKQP